MGLLGQNWYLYQYIISQILSLVNHTKGLELRKKNLINYFVTYEAPL